MTPESSVGGGLALLQTGDRVLIDLTQQRVDVLLDEQELDRRARQAQAVVSKPSQTPWQELYRKTVGPLDTGACLEQAVRFCDVGRPDRLPRHSH